MSTKQQQPGIAIVGMACVFPQAPSLRDYWRNICNKVDAISDPLPEWDADRYLQSGRINTARGGYLKDNYRFDPKRFGIMPNSVDGGEPDQFLALQVASEALADAGYLDGDYDHTDTGIILGHSTYLHRGQANLIQHQIVLDQSLELIQGLVPSMTATQREAVRDYLEQRLPQFNADVAPSLVPNVMTGRVANRLNLRGPNYLVDAACSSSLLALDAAMDELNSGRSQMMLAGGVNASLPAEVNVIFTQLGALSDSGKVRPFSAATDGTLLGEGLGVVVLKRLADAQSDGDRIYAVLRGVGQASDGKGQGLLAPSVQGEALAISRAYQQTGIDPRTIGLVEAHGTGIPLGDQTEIAALRENFGSRPNDNRSGRIALGSIKSMISHCIPAAGIAGVIKTSLALYHKILPPTICEEINPELKLGETPFYINSETRPWVHLGAEPRRAGVNAFGFGGVNAHAILEEAPERKSRSVDELTPWSDELFVFAAASQDQLVTQLKSLHESVAAASLTSLDSIAQFLTSNLATDAGTYRLAFTAADQSDLLNKLSQALKRLAKSDGSNSSNWQTRNGIYYAAEPVDGKLAFMFPGEGSQYINMFADLAQYFPEVHEWFEFWGALYQDETDECRTDILFPPPMELTEARKAALSGYLHQMDIGSEAVFVASQAMHRLLTAFGVSADAMIGHSTGESSALVAANAIANKNFADIGQAIRELNTVYRAIAADQDIVSGALLSVGVVSRDVIEKHIAEVDTGILFAMENCDNQAVLFGPSESIAKLRESLSKVGAICIPLPFDRGYHTPYFENVSQSFLDYYKNIRMHAPDIPLYSCASAEIFPDDDAAAQELAARQWSRKVRFTETIENMHRDGIRIFIEVGPSANLSAFVNDILSDRDFVGIATNVRKRRGLQQFLNTLGLLFVQGRSVDLEQLYAHREIAALTNVTEITQRTTESIAAERGMRLDNTMPVVRLSAAEQAELSALVGSNSLADMRLRAGPVGQQPKQSHFDAKSPNATNDANSAVVSDVIDATDVVMSEYLQLMQDFIAQQADLFANNEQLNFADAMRDEMVGELVDELVDGQAEGGAYEPPDLELPFLQDVQFDASGNVTAACDLSVSDDEFLRDHVLSGPVSEDANITGLSCVPLMVSIEIIAEACAALAGSLDLRVIRDVQANNWIALDTGAVNLSVRARWEDQVSGTAFWRVNQRRSGCRIWIFRICR